MKILLSPAKKMNENTDDFLPEGLPCFLDRAALLRDWVRELTPGQMQTLWKCNDQLLSLNEERFAEMDLHHRLTPAVMSYEGIAYQYMAPGVLEEQQLDYLRQHLRILSGFYGLLRPFDGVTPYRLEMQAKLKDRPYPGGSPDLYAFWNRSLYEELTREDPVILNLASREYSKAIEAWLTPADRYVTCVFGELSAGKVVTKATMAKMARGDMVRFLATVGAETPEEAKRYTGLEHTFREELSTDTEYVFIRTPG